jgi:hypothetical protein
MSKLLIDEYPLLVLPSLANMIGLNEAIALQQVHYWLNNAKGGVTIDGVRWVYNTYEEWQRDNFPFWSVRTVVRVFDHLEEMLLLVSMQKASYDRKKYYRIHYDNLSQWNMPDCHNASCQNGTIDHDKVASSLTETTTETSSENITREVLEHFTGYFGKFKSSNELERWGILHEAAGKELAEELLAWAFRKEIHLTNRGGLMDSLETAAKNWKEKEPPKNGANYAKRKTAPTRSGKPSDAEDAASRALAEQIRAERAAKQQARV